MNRNFIREVGFIQWLTRTAARQYYKRVLHQEHVMYLPTGERFLLPLSSHFASEVFVTNADVDWGSEALLFRLMKAEGCFLDIGANIGYYSLYMLPKATHIYSFEPDVRTVEFLKRNLSGKTNISLIQKAVGCLQGEVHFVLEDKGEVSHLAYADCRDAHKPVIAVEMVTIDSFVQEHDLKVEAIKTDVEGFDLDVLKGAMLTLKQQRPIVLTEAQPSLELFEFVHRINYLTFAFARDQKRKKYFREIKEYIPRGMDTKMLFLVPQELKPTVLQEAALMQSTPY